MKMKKSRKIAAVVCAAALVCCLGGLQVLSDSRKSRAPTAVECQPLETATLQNTVTASGTVKSASSTNVYTNLTATVRDVHVEVGDQVQAGDILCQLDSESLEDTLETRRLSLSVSQNTSRQTISASQKQYNDAVNNLDAGLNSTVNTVRDATASAKRALEKAQSDYEQAKSDLSADMNSQLVSAEEAVQQAAITEQRASQTYEDAKDQVGDMYKDLRIEVRDADKEKQAAQDLVSSLTEALQDASQDSGEYQSLKVRLELAEADLQAAKVKYESLQKELEEFETDSANTYNGVPLKTLRQNYEDARRARENAQKSLELAQAAVDDQLGTYQRAVEEAQIAYDSALTSQQATENSVRQGLEDQRQAIAASQASADTSVQEAEIASLEDQILDCTITAPVSGTVTAVYATEGAMPSGILFVIEDTGSLEVDVSIKEFDIGSVQEGMKALVRADALENQQFSGTLTSIAPAARSSASAAAGAGAAAASGNVEFAATVKVEDAGTPLRIGMNAKADIVLEEKTGVFAVPYESLGVNEAGEDVIFAAVEEGNGVYTLEEIPVTTGLETDLMVEISGSGLTEGMQIVSSADGMSAGQRITIASPQAAQQSGELMDQMLG